MLAFTNAKEKTSPTIIGAGCNLTGNIKTSHSIQIHGLVFGSIHADTVVIGRGGKVVGKVIAQNFFLHGTMEGPASVDTANIFNNAQMTGTLSYHTLNITGNNGLECKLTKKKDKQ
ncbi:MAG: polymer-forming cytoskeletal protein [Rickettsiales bacterium]|jgi:cytoskeletal protein CcmA (bactofilin family)|nr:polymer-forming cytoskeletal protein [Rickettsiales bacterium]